CRKENLWLALEQGSPNFVNKGSRKSPGVSGSKKWPMTGGSGRNSVTLLVSAGGIVSHYWYQWEE
ncbi:unnamed protein product, partial [Staurois parvus]